MKLETERLVLRDVRKFDVMAIVKNIGNLNVSRYLLVVPHPYTKRDGEWWVNKCIEEQENPERTKYNFGIAIKPSNKLVGGVGLTKRGTENNSAEIGYWIGEPYWGKGYVSEAARKIIDFGFEKLKLSEIIIPIFSENERSQNLAKDLGAKLVEKKHKRVTSKATGIEHKEMIYVLSKEDFYNSHKK